ncbi:hypothetical protein HPB52_007740 [Rhipicephalus sanguineus]|uniref:Uncharacterized protein n=1 Tax=Rhipicephalus sanguineus TaxID=34632 RepID=A0A9D4PQM4_RHISA|nr:hypothetical protein HPB52_007740 [Rhipicephalus sanguineus]
MTEDSLAGAQLRAQTDNEPPHGGGDAASFGYVQLDILCWLALWATAVGLFMWMLRNALHREPDEPSLPPSTPGFCCETLAIEMSRRANLSVDACSNFLDYACFHREGLAEANQKLFVTEVLYPTLQGTIRTPASDVLRSYYLSCLMAFVEGRSTTEEAVNAVIDMFFTLSGDADLRVVDIAGIVEIKYRTSLLLDVQLQLDTNKKTCAAKFFSGYNFEIFSYVKAETGGTLVSDTMTVTISDTSIIRSFIDIVESPHFRSQSLVLFVFGTTASLFDKEFLSDRITGEGSAKWTQFCDTDIGALYELWDLVSVHRFTNHERDNTLRSLYDSISGAVVADAIDIFASPEDAEEVRTLISRVRLLSPAQLTHWYQAFLPNLKEDYCANVIAVRAFRRKTLLHAEARGLGDISWTRRMGLDAYAILLDEVIAVAPILYADINVKARRETYITAAMVGVEVASALWVVLFERQGWSKAALEQLQRHLDCIEDQVFDEDPTELAYPLLSLHSTVRAVAGAGWHTPIRMWSLWTMSPSQFFYMRFYLRHVCQRDAQLRQMARTTNFMRRIPDFSAAFHCQSMPKAAGCVYDLRVAPVAA